MHGYILARPYITIAYFIWSRNLCALIVIVPWQQPIKYLILLRHIQEHTLRHTHARIHTKWRRQGGFQGCWHPSARHPAREKLICASKNGGTSAVSLVTVDFSKPSIGLRTCLDDPPRPLTIGLGDTEEIQRK